MLNYQRVIMGNPFRKLWMFVFKDGPKKLSKKKQGPKTHWIGLIFSGHHSFPICDGVRLKFSRLNQFIEKQNG